MQNSTFFKKNTEAATESAEAVKKRKGVLKNKQIKRITQIIIENQNRKSCV